MADVAENDARARLAPPPPEASGDSGASFFFSTSWFFCVCAVGDPQSVELSSTGEHFYRFNDGFDNKLVSFHERYARARRRARERGAATAAEYARSQAAKGGGERDDVARGARDRAVAPSPSSMAEGCIIRRLVVKRRENHRRHTRFPCVRCSTSVRRPSGGAGIGRTMQMAASTAASTTSSISASLR